MRQVAECIKRDVYILNFADTLYTLQLDAYTVVGRNKGQGAALIEATPVVGAPVHVA